MPHFYNINYSRYRLAGEYSTPSWMTSKNFRQASRELISIEGAPLIQPWKEARAERYLTAVQRLGKCSFQGRQIMDFSEYEVDDLKVSPRLKDLLRLVRRRDHLSELYRTRCYPHLLKELRYFSKQLLKGSLCDLEAEVVSSLCQGHFMIQLGNSASGQTYLDSLFTTTEYDSLLDPVALDKRMKQAFKERGTQIECSDMIRRLSANNFLSSSRWDAASYSIRSSLGSVKVGSREVQLLRMACPVVGSNTNPQVDPLFKAYLKSLGEGERHLYVNNLSHDVSSDKRRKFGFKCMQPRIEMNRSKALEKLACDKEYRDRLFMVSLPHDSDFYHQKKRAGKQLAEPFINEFMTNLAFNKQGFYLPNIEGRKQLLVDIRTRLLDIHQKYFENSVCLTQEERHNFIQIAYSAITAQLMEHLKITRANITCKDGVDRAMGSTANLMTYLNPNVSSRRIVNVISLAAALNHARGPKLSRIKRSLGAINRIRSYRRAVATY